MSERFERAVRSPDGREWRVRVDLYRRPPPLPEEREGVLGRLESGPFPLWLLPPVARLVRIAVLPILEATLLRRPWIEASAEDPPVTMVWQATGRRSTVAAVDEIADALARGEERPIPLSARWVGYDRGSRLGRKM